MRRVFECDVQSPWYELIESGAKTVEGRLLKGTFAELHAAGVGSRLLVRGPEAGVAPLLADVVRLQRYASFREYLEAEGLNATLPGVKRTADGVRIYRQFYSAAKEKQFGVLAVELSRIRHMRRKN